MEISLLLHKKHFSAQVACRCFLGNPVIVHNATYLTPPHPNGGGSPAAHTKTYPAERCRRNGFSLGSLLKYHKRSRFSTPFAYGYTRKAESSMRVKPDRSDHSIRLELNVEVALTKT